MSQQSPEQSQPAPAPLNSQNVPLVKPQQGPNSTRREIDRIARQLDGLSKSLKRLKEAT